MFNPQRGIECQPQSAVSVLFIQAFNIRYIQTCRL
jgi:hypothetical protein